MDGLEGCRARLCARPASSFAPRHVGTAGAQRTTGRRGLLEHGLASIGSGIGAAADARSAFLISLAGPTAVIRRATGSIRRDRRRGGRPRALIALATGVASSMVCLRGRPGPRLAGSALSLTEGVGSRICGGVLNGLGVRLRLAPGLRRGAQEHGAIDSSASSRSPVFTPSFWRRPAGSEPAIVVKFEFGHDFLFRTGCRREGQDDR